MTDLWSAVLVFVLLLAAAAAGLFVQRFLADEHRSQASRELSQAVTGMLVTFAAIVLGLLIGSVKDSFDQAERNVRTYAVALIELGQTLHDLGPPADPARDTLRAYVAGTIASTWPDQAAPRATPQPSLEDPALGAILYRAGHEISRLAAEGDPGAALAKTQFEQAVRSRWTLIESAHNSIPMPFYRVLVSWLMLVFASLGLVSPRNALTTAMVGLAALSIASVVFTALELDGPFGGLLAVPADPMRHALAHLGR